MSETWAPIPGFEGRWDASTEGRIRSIPRPRTRGGILKQSVNKRGYLSVGLGRDSHEVHRLIALAFLGPRPVGMETRHVDGNPLNCKTHCPQGHPYFGDNLLVIPSRPTARYCRACNAERKLRERAP